MFGWRTGDGWTPTDRTLILALQLYEESLCRCGFPWWMGHAEEHIGEDLFRRVYDKCLICEKSEEDAPKDLTPGDHPRIVNRLFGRFGLPGFRQAIRRQQKRELKRD